MPPLPDGLYYHSILNLVLEGHVDPSSIFEFYYPSHWSTPSKPDLLADQGLYKREGLFKTAVHASPFIPADMVSEVCTRFRNGDPDAALVVLLPLCTRLKLLEFFSQSKLCAAMFQSIAQEHRRRGITPEEARQTAKEAALRDLNDKPWLKSPPKGSLNTLPLPFSELLFLYVSSHQHGYSFSLGKMVPFMCFPSLHRMIFTAVRDKTFQGWPAGNASCSCPEIYFQEASVSEQAVLAFAQALDAPCEIRQWYERPRTDVSDSEEDDPTWDRVLVKHRPDGSKETEARLDYKGGNPGYDHAWVSWLYHMKMQDWRRIGTAFSTEEGDSNDCWLQGGFA